MKLQVRFSGSGGQGLILAGILLAEAAIEEGKKALQSQSYGPESRGGSSRADVIISDEEIYYPRALELDILLALTQQAADKFIPDMKHDGTLVYDSSLVRVNPISGRAIGIPFSEYAVEKFHNPMVTNILCLSFLGTISQLVTPETLKKIIRTKIKPKFVDLNLKAAEFGISLAQDYLKNKS